MKESAAVVALLLATAGAAWPGDTPVTVSARIEPERPTIGTPFRYEVEVLAPQGTEVIVEQPAESIGGLDVVDFDTEPAEPAPKGRVALRRWWKLVAWSPGSYALETPPVRFRLNGEELTEATPHEIRVEVPSVIAATAGELDIKDIKPPRALPVDRRPYYALVALAAVVFLGFLVARRLGARRRRGPVVLPPPPHVVATAELAELSARRLPERGAFKEYYSALSGIVRKYTESRFGLRAPEMTTEEFLVAAARDFQLAVPHRRMLGEFLAESDLVKFARHHPSTADSENAFRAARRYVDETSPQPTEGHRAAG